MVNFVLLAAEIVSLVWAPLQISTSFASWQCYCTVYGVEQRASPVFDRAAIRKKKKKQGENIMVCPIIRATIKNRAKI